MVLPFIPSVTIIVCHLSHALSPCRSKRLVCRLCRLVISTRCAPTLDIRQPLSNQHPPIVLPSSTSTLSIDPQSQSETGGFGMSQPSPDLLAPYPSTHRATHSRDGRLPLGRASGGVYDGAAGES